MKKGILLLLLMTFLLGGCGTAEKVNSKGPVAKVEDQQDIYLMAGKIEANEEINLVSKIQARVAQISVEVGAAVKKGDPLIYLDIQDVKAQVKQVEVGVKVAQAALNRAQKGIRPEQIAQAQAVLEGAQVSSKNAENNLHRMEQLLADGGISTQQLEAAQGQFSAAQAQLKSAQEQVNMLSKGETPEAIGVLETQVKQAQAALELARTQLNNGIITSPVAGLISVRNVDNGEMALPGQPLLTVISNEQVYINANVPPRLINKLKAGQDVIAKVSEIPDQKFSGKIEVISPTIDSRTKSLLVKVGITDPNTRLKPGMIAEIGLKR